jgi:SAM-dependent methyltransferase
MTELPFSQACENNKAPILDILQTVFSDSTKVLEIGSGTGQHAVHFAVSLPHLLWQPSDQREYLAGLKLRLAVQHCENILAPVELDVTQPHWPESFDAVFSSNTSHIMSWPVAQHMLKTVAQCLPEGGVFALYGPFNYGGKFTSPSNADFDAWLKEQDPERGLRDFEDVNRILDNANMSLLDDFAMPANNRLLVWKKLAY